MSQFKLFGGSSFHKRSQTRAVSHLILINAAPLSFLYKLMNIITSQPAIVKWFLIVYNKFYVKICLSIRTKVQEGSFAWKPKIFIMTCPGN